MPRRRKSDADGLHGYVCSREACRRPYRITGKKACNINSGLCPRCKALAAAKRGDLLDPKLYALCQQIAKAERRLVGNGGDMKKSAWRKRKAAKAVMDGWGPRRRTVLEAERLVGGASPGARSGKVGGPSGRNDG